MVRQSFADPFVIAVSGIALLIADASTMGILLGSTRAEN
jgi:hypothetical protein